MMKMRKSIGVMAATAAMLASMGASPEFDYTVPIRGKSKGKSQISGSIPQSHAKRHTNKLHSRTKAKQLAKRKSK